MRIFNYIFATGLGAGFSPVAPGTAGSILAVLIIYFIPPISPWLLILSLFILFWVGVYTGGQLEKELGEDPSQVVIDEIVGMGISLLFLPLDWRLLLIAFILFRLFDIWKPFPVKLAEKMHGGLGIMLDDVIAGIYALIGVHLLRWLFFI